ncbi:MAG TPA: class I SAM-dependent methyltransferase [Solirubrobacterales bacterium]
MSAIGEIADDGTIIDCPCGAGPALRALRPDAEVRYVAADLSPSMLSRARKRAQARGLADVDFVMADATDIPEPGNSADLFLSYWGLHCFGEPAAAIDEAARLLKPGGRLVGSCFVLEPITLRQRLLLRPNTGDFGPIGTQAEVEGWLASAGFEPPRTRRSGPMLFFDTSLTHG